MTPDSIAADIVARLPELARDNPLNAQTFIAGLLVRYAGEPRTLNGVGAAEGNSPVPIANNQPPPTRPDAVTLTDSPALVDLKAQYHQLDERHEVVKKWPDSWGKDAELYRICVAKAEIAQKVLLLGPAES